VKILKSSFLFTKETLDLSSNLGGSMIDGTVIDVDTDKGPTLGFHGLLSMIGAEFNNAFTSFVDSSMSKFYPK